MTHSLLAVAQWVVRTNEFFLGVEGVLFGVVLFSSLLIYIQHKQRKAARLL